MEELDHRNLGKQLDIYHIQEDAPGMVFWHARGYAIYRVLEDYIRLNMRRNGYHEVRTPQLMPRGLWEKSGHWEKFRQNMYCVSDEDREMALKPMSCPCHLQIFNERPKSYRDLPVRYAEFGACHRNEASGSLHGLMRTKAFEQDDAHVLCREDQVADEVRNFIVMIDRVYRELGFSDYRVALSTRPVNRAGSDEVWDFAEKQLANAAIQQNLDFTIQEGEGAFYGPKLEFILRDSRGREWQCGTVQLDLVLPERLGSVYVDENGRDAVPIMIHHAVFGSVGRFIGVLLEHHEGRLPFWLAPVQVAIIPISIKQQDFAADLRSQLLQKDIRVELYDEKETLSRRIVSFSGNKVPIAMIVGAKEELDGTVTLRRPDGSQESMGIESAMVALSAMNVTQ